MTAPPLVGCVVWSLHHFICFFALAYAIIIFYVLPLFHFVFAVAHLCLLRHFHSNQVPNAPLAKASPCVCISLWGTDGRWLDHSSIHHVDGLLISLLVSCMNLLLNFIRFLGTVWRCNGCLVLFTWSPFLFNTSPYGSGAIPASYLYYLSVDIL